MYSDALLELISSWRQLTLDEKGALQRHDWETVARCQAAKGKLQKIIAELPAAEIVPNENEGDLRQRIEELVALEHANGAIVDA
jgi:hypothetical protein